jgi:hypothetical protein
VPLVPTLAVGTAMGLLALGMAGHAVAQQPSTPAPGQQYTQLAQGVLTSSTPLFTTDSVPRYRVEVRDFVIGPNKSVPRLPIEGYTLLELRAGAIETTSGGKAVRRETGSVWLALPKTALAIRNVGEVAILRATVLIPR